jgi:hypothetical protein
MEYFLPITQKLFPSVDFRYQMHTLKTYKNRSFAGQNVTEI